MGLVVTLPFTLTNGTTADASQVMANYNALVTAFTLAAAAGVNADITALTALTTPIPPASGGSTVYVGGTSTGSANAQVVASPVPISFSLSAGKRIVFIAGFTNTGATTLNVNAQGATAVFRMSPSGPQALTGGEIIAGNIVEAIYDGTQFELISVHNQFGGFGPLTSLASATSADLGTIPSHNVNITGTTTITGFGSTASTTFPVYKVRFAGVLTLTNGAALLLPGNANITTAANDTLTALYLGSGNWIVTEYQRISGLPIVAFTNSTRQVLLSGTAATYTTPAGCRQLRVRLVGGGGGGGALATNAGTIGGDTTFNQAVAPVTGTGGSGGATAATQTGGAGGTGGAAGAGSSFRIPGSDGGSGGQSGAASVSGIGGHGGVSAFGGAGRAGTSGAAGQNAKTNSGSGGGGASGGSATSGAGGGGAGEYVEAIYTSPAATYQYTVGAGGAGGAAGTLAGGNGAAGIIIVDEYY